LENLRPRHQRNVLGGEKKDSDWLAYPRGKGQKKRGIWWGKWTRCTDLETALVDFLEIFTEEGKTARF